MRRQLISRLAAGLLLLAGVSAGSLPPWAGTPAAQPTFRVDWNPCPEISTVQCGTLQVPLDWSNPNGQRVPIAVARRPADNPAARVGTLFFNPGGPGDPSTRYLRGYLPGYFSPAVLARFDLVAMDPRGMGGSVQMRCSVPLFTPESTLFPRTEAEFERQRRHNRELGESCVQHSGALVSNMDTATVAHDHEALRLALRVDKVTWLGISYGSQLAANYANMFPRHTRAMVLDAALEHSQPEGEQSIDATMAMENSFNRFAKWCDTSPACALRGQDVAAVYDRLVAAADAHPIPTEGALRPVTGTDIRMGTVGMIALKEEAFLGPTVSWAALSQAIAAAVAGDASAFMLFPAGVPQDGIYGRGTNACGDYVPQIDSWDRMQQRMQIAKQIAPHTQGASETWQVNYCIGWPVKASNPPKALDVRGVPTLLVHAVNDPMDPYRWTQALASQIQGSDILTRTGDGHTSYNTSPCARAAIDDYLVRPQAPAVGICDE